MVRTCWINRMTIECFREVPRRDHANFRSWLHFTQNKILIKHPCDLNSSWQHDCSKYKNKSMKMKKLGSMKCIYNSADANCTRGWDFQPSQDGRGEFTPRQHFFPFFICKHYKSFDHIQVWVPPLVVNRS